MASEREGQAARDRREAGSGDGSRESTAGTEREATEVEREGMDLLGRSGVRDDAIAGVSDPSARADQDVNTNREDLGDGGR